MIKPGTLHQVLRTVDRPPAVHSANSPTTPASSPRMMTPGVVSAKTEWRQQKRRCVLRAPERAHCWCASAARRRRSLKSDRCRRRRSATPTVPTARARAQSHAARRFGSASRGRNTSGASITGQSLAPMARPSVPVAASGLFLSVSSRAAQHERRDDALHVRRVDDLLHHDRVPPIERRPQGRSPGLAQVAR